MITMLDIKLRVAALIGGPEKMQKVCEREIEKLQTKETNLTRKLRKLRDVGRAMTHVTAYKANLDEPIEPVVEKTKKVTVTVEDDDDEPTPPKPRKKKKREAIEIDVTEEEVRVEKTTTRVPRNREERRDAEKARIEAIVEKHSTGPKLANGKTPFRNEYKANLDDDGQPKVKVEVVKPRRYESAAANVLAQIEDDNLTEEVLRHRLGVPTNRKNRRGR